MVGTAGVYFVQSMAQRYVDTATTALLYTAEPLFAALFAVLLSHERPGLYVLAGGICIVAAMTLGS